MYSCIIYNPHPIILQIITKRNRILGSPLIIPGSNNKLGLGSESEFTSNAMLNFKLWWKRAGCVLICIEPEVRMLIVGFLYSVKSHYKTEHQRLCGKPPSEDGEH